MKTIQLAIAFVFLSLSTVVAQDNADMPQAIKRFVAEDTIAIGHLKLTQLNLNALVDWAVEVEGVDAAEAESMHKVAKEYKEGIDHLQLLGVNDAYMFISMSDIFGGAAPIVVMPIADPQKRRASEYESEIMEVMRRYEIPATEIVVQDGYAVLGNTKDRINAVLEKGTVNRPKAAAAWQTIKNSQFGAALIGDADSRQVLRQVFPPLPAPFEAITGKMIADEMEWATLGIDFPPKPAARIVAEADNPQAVATLSKATDAAMKTIAEMPAPGGDKELGAAFKKMIASMAPTTNGNRIELDLEKFLSDKDAQKLFGSQLRKTRGSALDSQRMNQLRSLYLAMLNFESAFGKFPAYATVDENDKPLLSWRVQILQFMEEGELYEKFHHDEPWDSEHNLKLVKEIPHLFQDPGNPGLNKEGKTRFLCPYGEGYFMEGNEPLQLRNFTDGTSRTLSIVQVNPDQAVPWTKPADWKVDAKDPWKGVKPADKNGKLMATMSDGSAHRCSQEMAAEVLLSILTRNGGEPVNSDDMK